MDIILITTGIFCLIAGLAGCIIPMLPGPPVAYVGLILLHMTQRAQLTTSELVVGLVVVIVVQVLDYFIPMLGTKYTGGGGKWANRGTLIGTLVGILFLPWGIIIGPFVGAFLGATKDGADNTQALKSGIGSLIGFLLGTVLKFVVCGYFIWVFIRELI
ncbi:MAG: DUF456 domain-containing protein [Bacteroidaceae bacterium]|nr:DUF456 domain-containing protein [Bacteroidaceae bacterium]